MSIKSNKVKLFATITIPAIILASSGIATAIVLAKQHNSTPIGKGNLLATFNPGEGQITSGSLKAKFYTGSTIEQIPQPKVNAKGKIFAGWKKEDGSYIKGCTKIDSNVNLVADYVNESTSNYVKITFKPGTTYPTATINGPEQVMVLRGSAYFMMNRPNASYLNYYFKGWALDSDGQRETVISEKTIFKNDTVLVPVFEKQAKLTFNAGGGTWVEGEQEQYVPLKTKFKDINPPTYRNGIKWVEGWYKDKDCTIPWNIDETGGKTADVVTADASAYPKWIDDESLVDKYVNLSFASTITYKDVEYPIVYTGNTNMIWSKATTSVWDSINKPRPVVKVSGVVSSYYTIDYWQAKNVTTSTWTKIESNSKATDFGVSTTTATLEIRPVMKMISPTVHLYTLDKVMDGTTQAGIINVKPGDTVNLTAFLDGQVDQKIDWTLTGGGTHITFDETTTNPTNVLKIAENITTLTTTTLTIEAKYQADSSIKATMTVNITFPQHNSDKIWTFDSNAGKWYWIDEDTLYDPTAAIKLVSLTSGATTEVARASFNLPIYVGDQVDTIRAHFLADCTSFNKQIYFTPYAKTSGGVEQYKLTNISSDFLSGCSAFDQTLTLPTSLVNIGDGFLNNCDIFGKTAILTLPANLEYIGNDFLFNCVKFDQALTIPKKVYEIGSNFLAGCTTFNQNLDVADLDASVTTRSIGGHFMYGCDAFESTLTISGNTSFVKSNYTLATNNTTITSGKGLLGKGFSVASKETGTAGSTIVEKFSADYPTIETTETTASAFRLNRASYGFNIVIPSDIKIGTTKYDITIKCFKWETPSAMIDLASADVTLLDANGATLAKDTTASTYKWILDTSACTDPCIAKLKVVKYNRTVEVQFEINRA